MCVILLFKFISKTYQKGEAMKKQITTEKAPLPLGAYSQGLVINDRMYVSGQGPMDVTTGKMPNGIERQTTQVLKNIEAILEAGGFSMADVVKSTVHLANMNDFMTFNETYIKHFPDILPVRTTVQSVLPGGKEMLVEIDVIAEK